MGLIDRVSALFGQDQGTQGRNSGPACQRIASSKVQTVLPGRDGPGLLRFPDWLYWLVLQPCPPGSGKARFEALRCAALIRTDG